MATCENCGREFKKSSAKKFINRRYGKGAYDDYDLDGLCAECADCEMGASEAAASELIEQMGYDNWIDD